MNLCLDSNEKLKKVLVGRFSKEIAKTRKKKSSGTGAKNCICSIVVREINPVYDNCKGS